MHVRTTALSMLATLALLPVSLGANTPKTAPAGSADTAPAVSAPKAGMHRYMVVRTFPAGALAGLDAAGKKTINATNAKYGVHWLSSFATANKITRVVTMIDPATAE